MLNVLLARPGPDQNISILGQSPRNTLEAGRGSSWYLVLLASDERLKVLSRAKAMRLDMSSSFLTSHGRTLGCEAPMSSPVQRKRLQVVSATNGDLAQEGKRWK